MAIERSTVVDELTRAPARADHHRAGGRGARAEPQGPLGRGAAADLRPAVRVPHGRAPRRRGTRACSPPRWPSTAIVSHRSAAELWGLIQPAGYAEVSVPGGTNRDVRPPAIVHRIIDLHPELAVEREGLRVTDPVRTVIDLGLVMPWWLVHRAIAQGASRPERSSCPR